VSKKQGKGHTPIGTGLGGGLVRQVQQMQENMLRAQEALANETLEITAGGGAVRIVITGDQRIVSITILPEAVDPDDVQMLQDMLVVAMNAALDQSRALAAERLQAVTGGLNIPGLT